MMPISDERVQKTIAFVLLAAIAGALSYLQRSVDKGRPIKLTLTILNSCTSGFVGFLSLMVCFALGLSPEWTGVIVGVFGWLGAEASIKILEKVARRRLGIADENPFVPPYQGEERR